MNLGLIHVSMETPVWRKFFKMIREKEEWWNKG